MAKNRKAAEEVLYKWINKIDKSGYNLKIYKELFSKMSNTEFDRIATAIRDGRGTLFLYMPMESEVKLTIANNIKIAEEMGVPLFQSIKSGPKGTIGEDGYMPENELPNKYLVYDLTYRRTSQTLAKGISVGETGSKRDMLTGQLTGEDRSVRVTKPELEVLTGLGLEKSLVELYKIRGGDEGANNAANLMLNRTGKATQEVVNQYGTGVVSTRTLDAMFKAAHIKSNALTVAGQR